jgi:putative membrane protein
MPRNLLIVGAACAALSLAACQKKTNETQGAATPAEQAATPSANPAATVPTPSNEATAADFVPKAAASDMFEIQAGQLAEKRATNPDVKAFAAMMVRDHTKSSAALKKAIADSGQNITLPTALPSDKQTALNDLTNADVQAFDRRYMEGQVDAHQQALNLLQRYAQDGDVPAIKAWAAATAPTVQQHYDRARAIRDALK